MKKKVLFIFLIILIILTTCFSVLATSKRGSSGSDVRQLQEKLK